MKNFYGAIQLRVTFLTINKIVSTHKKALSLGSISDFDEEIKTYLRKNFALISH